MKKLWLLFLGAPSRPGLYWVPAPSFGRGGSLGRPTSARDYFDYCLGRKRRGSAS